MGNQGAISCGCTSLNCSFSCRQTIKQRRPWHGKARQLAAEIWSCFEAFEQRVRELPEFETDVQAATA